MSFISNILQNQENLSEEDLLNMLSENNLLNVLTIPTWRSILKMRLFEPASYNLESTSFSTPNTTPSLQRIPIAVLHEQKTPAHKTRLFLN